MNWRRRTDGLQVRESLAFGLYGLASAAYVVPTAYWIWVYGFSELFADQFRAYRVLVTVPFPVNLIVPDNGHPQAVPNLIRYLDIRVFAGDQTLGVVVGLATLLLTIALIVLAALRDTAAPRDVRAAAVLLASLALGWLGSARMQFHGNESFMTYWVICTAILGGLAVERAIKRRQLRWLGVAVLLALSASLSCAPGLAVFGMLLGLVLVRRCDRRAIAWILATTTAVVLAAFLLALLFPPAAFAEQTTMSFDFVASAVAVPAWLASCWITGWLGLPDYGAFGAAGGEYVRTVAGGSALVNSAQAIRGVLGGASPTAVAAVIGAVGLLAGGLVVRRSWRSPERVGRLEVLGLSLVLFSVGVAGLVALTRAALFATNPDQLFADRYVVWSCVFWLGLALCLMARLPDRRVVHLVLMATCLLLAAAAAPVHRVGVVWAAEMARRVEARAAQAQAGVLLPGFESHADLRDLAQVRETLAFYRNERLAVFRSPRSQALGTIVASALLSSRRQVPEPSIIHVTVPSPAELANEASALHIWGAIQNRSHRTSVDGLWLIDTDGRVVGLGEFSFEPESFLSGPVSRVGRGFDVYAQISSARCRGLMLVGVDDEATHLFELSRVDAC